jgi:phospholipase D1/2
MAADIYTAQVTKDTLSSITGQYFDMEKPFAFPRYGNACKPYTTGRDYLEAVAHAIRNANSFILITDWQLDYDVELEQRGKAGHPGRLSELLAAAIQRGVHIRILLYDSISKALDTHDDTSQDMLHSLPKGKGSISVMLQNPNTGRTTLSRESGLLFSHHQKSVVVDGKIAFLGGLDLAYGRWDTNAFNVVIDPAQRIINDAYNQQLVAARSLTDSETKLLKDKSGRPGFHPSYGKDGKVFDERFQPRQPWQDVALHIDGPAVYDVFVNFILRWNSFAGSGTNVFDGSMAVDWFKKAKGADYLVDPLALGSGTATVQICRSTSSKQLKDELVLWDDRHYYIHDDWKKTDLKRRKIVQAARAEWVSSHQTSILDAMVNCIRSAQAFIYIENQFFMSNCGVDEYGTQAPSNNKIIHELANAVGKAIYAGRPFHIWLTLPEHPEGVLEDAGTNSQAWWALQGVKRGRDSLVHQINAFIVSKHAKAWGLQKVPKANSQISSLLLAKGLEHEWQRYLTVLNLRNYGHTPHYVLTEMIYVHSKLLIVDDAVAIIGSANINDRSLNGNGDTELAAVVVDAASGTMTDVGQDIKIITRKFARDLRISLWKKHLGMSVDEPTTGVQKGDVPEGIEVMRPLSAASIKGIKKLAKANHAAYETVFLHTPRDGLKTLTEGREKAYPILSAKDGTRDFSKPPRLQDPYMQKNAHLVDKSIKFLDANIRGFWVQMPLSWAHGQKETPEAPQNLPQAIAQNNNEKEVFNV